MYFRFIRDFPVESLPSQAARVKLLLGNCGDELSGVPEQLLEATHLILTMRRRALAIWVES